MCPSLSPIFYFITFSHFPLLSQISKKQNSEYVKYVYFPEEPVLTP